MTGGRYDWFVIRREREEEKEDVRFTSTLFSPE
jgi:hypothetical protein